MSRPVVGELADQNSDNEVGNEHQSASGEEQWSSTEAIHGPETAGDTDELGDVQDARHDEAHVVIEAHCLESI